MYQDTADIRSDVLTTLYCIMIQGVAGQADTVSRMMRICGNHDYAKGPDTCQVIIYRVT